MSKDSACCFLLIISVIKRFLYVFANSIWYAGSTGNVYHTSYYPCTFWCKEDSRVRTFTWEKLPKNSKKRKVLSTMLFMLPPKKLSQSITFAPPAEEEELEVDSKPEEKAERKERD